MAAAAVVDRCMQPGVMVVARVGRCMYPVLMVEGRDMCPVLLVVGRVWGLGARHHRGHRHL